MIPGWRCHVVFHSYDREQAVLRIFPALSDKFSHTQI